MWQMKVVLIPLPSSLPDIFLSQLSLKKPHDDNNVSCVIQNVFVSVDGCYFSVWGKKQSFNHWRWFRISQAQPKQRSTRTLDRSLSCFPHASHSISHSLYLAACLVFSPPLLVWWLSLHSLCSSRTPHSALSAVSDSDRTSQTAAVTDITLPLVSPLADLIPLSLSFPFTLHTHRTESSALSLIWRLSQSPSFSSCSGTDWLVQLYYEEKDVIAVRTRFSRGRTVSCSRLSKLCWETEVATPVCRPDGVWWDGESKRKRSLGCFPHPERPVGKITESPFDFCSCIQKNLCNLASHISNHNAWLNWVR